MCPCAIVRESGRGAAREELLGRGAPARSAARGLAWCVVIVACTAPLFANPSQTAAGDHPVCDQGPFRIRNQFPLNLHFLSFPAEDTEMVAARRWGVTVDLTTANVNRRHSFIGGRVVDRDAM